MVTMGYGAAVAAAACAWGLTAAMHGPRRHRPGVRHLEVAQPVEPGERLRVLTLNVAHGRGNRLVQRVMRRGRTETQLERIAGLLRREQAHVVALQEADAHAFWSGRFNHVDFLARRTGCAGYMQMRHVDGMGLAYGTALLASCELREGSGGTFQPSPPTFPKGWISAVVPWAAIPAGAVRVVSVHLDFSRVRCRRSQLQELAEALSAEPLPLVVMGDFNSDMRREAVLHDLMARLGLHTFEPAQPGLSTHPATRRRLDWILVSRQLRFAGHAVLDETVSDHRAVTADLVPAPADTTRQ